MEILKTEEKRRKQPLIVFQCLYCHSDLRAFKGEFEVYKEDDPDPLNIYYCPVCGKKRMIKSSLLHREG